MYNKIVCCLILCFAGYAFGAATQAWLYDAPSGNVACGAQATYQANNIDVLKPGFISIDDNGNLSLDIQDYPSLCNEGSPANIADWKAHSTEQYATVGSMDNGVGPVQALVGNPTKVTTAINTLVNFVQSSGITGIEIDFEGYEEWSTTVYSQYVSFLTTLGNRLHAIGKKLMVDVPAIDSTDSQNYYKYFTYQGLNNAPIDYIAIMCYDGYYDGTCGTPVASNSYVNNTIKWAFAKITDHNKIVMGIPSYGYHCATGTTNFPDNTDTLSQSQTFPGFSTATRDPNSYEMMWRNGGISYIYVDQTGLDLKRKLIESWGVKAVSVWHLGGNAWFSN
jgi:spore germination protein YaaH